MPPWVEREVIAGHLLDVAGAWRWLAAGDARGDQPGETAGTQARVPVAVGTPTTTDLEKLLAPADAPTSGPPIPRDAARPVQWIHTEGELQAMCEALRPEPFIGFDVETTLQSRALCLLQIAGNSTTYLLDALTIPDLSPLADLLGDPAVVKVIHNASFERSVLSRYGFAIDGVADTLHISRKLRGTRIDGGHSLKSVCERELGIVLDKSEQVSDWSRRPLSERQVAYAALDAEVLLQLYARFGQPPARTAPPG